jgi:Cd2+/Zn2+-exporting ATPase
VEASTDRGLILAGNPALLAGHGVEVPPACEVSGQAHTAVYIAGDGAYLGRILIGDSLKEGAAGAVAALRRLGVADILMFTGDEAGAASDAAATLGITQVESGLLPADKLARVEELTKTGTTVFVGDGINDAPVLARADVGIAMGSGADAAIEAADVIIMTGDPGRVPEAIVRARKTRRIIMENVVFALGTKAAFIALAVLGLANMWIAIIGDVGVCLAAVLNSTRSLKTS